MINQSHNITPSLGKASSFFVFRQIFSLDNEVSVDIMFSYMYWLLHWQTPKIESPSDKMIMTKVSVFCILDIYVHV